ncbi:MAG: relaxase/mobilization nuclease domain-containing protein [Henriciella sp.]
MVPKVAKKNAGRGSSFKGVAAYVLNDKDTTHSAERVAWTHTENLATVDPDLAWRIMAATAMDAPRLKREAGVKNTGRQSHQNVFHYTIAWHPEEAQDLNKEEMLRAARLSLRALGVEDRQALIVAHSDQEQPHLHIVINRVSPKDGRMWVDSHSKRKLRDFASDYERERGKIYCPKREANRLARDAGMPHTGQKNVIWPDAQAAKLAGKLNASNDNHPAPVQALVAARSRAAELTASTARMKTRHKGELEEQVERSMALKKSIDRKLNAARSRARTRIRKMMQPELEAIERRHEKERQEFEEAQKSLLGRATNLLKAAALGQGVREGDAQKGLLTRAQNAAARIQNPREAMETRHKADMAAFKRKHTNALAPLMTTARDLSRAAEADRLSIYVTELGIMKERQQKERERQAELWRENRAVVNIATKDLETMNEAQLKAQNQLSYRDRMQAHFKDTVRDQDRNQGD